MAASRLSFNFSPYLPEDAASRLAAYRYAGEDHSLVYQRFWRPLCSASVNYLPFRLAPNIITLSALAAVIFTHIIFWWYMPYLTVPGLEVATTNGIPMVDSNVFHYIAEQLSLSLSADSGVTSLNARLNQQAMQSNQLYQGRVPNVEENSAVFPPAAIFVCAAFTLFLYQFLDNLDGHQARRTGVTGPLGLLMDHGCDAFNCVVGAMTMSSALCLGATWKSWLALHSAVVVFLISTWEEYYRGALILPIVNGPNEGIFMCIGGYLVTALCGPAFWLQTVQFSPRSLFASFGLGEMYTFLTKSPLIRENPVFGDMIDAVRMPDTDGEEQWGVMLNSIVLLSIAVMAIPGIIGNYRNVWRAVNKRDPIANKYGFGHGTTMLAEGAQGWLLRKFPFIHALTRLIPALVVTVFGQIWIYVSPRKIYQLHPRLCIWTLGLLYTKLAIHLMIAHMCNIEYHPFRRTFVPFVYLAAHVSITYCLSRYSLIEQINADGSRSRSEENSFNERLLLFEFFSLATVTFVHLVINVVIDTSAALKVPIFTVPREKYLKLQAEFNSQKNKKTS